VQEVSSSVPLKLKVKSSTYLLTGVVWVAVTTPDESVAKYCKKTSKFKYND